MSVRSETYLMVAVALKEFDYEEKENLLLPWCGKEATGMLGVLYDGMGGEYILAGKVLAVANEEEGIPVTRISLKTDGVVFTVHNWLIHNKLASCSVEDIGLYIVTHFH